MTNPNYASELSSSLLGGKYRLGGRLGEGGMGAVYEAVQEDLGRRVAVKVLHPHLASDHEAIARFRREAQAAAALGHPNIVQVTDFQWRDGEPAFLVMELLHGASLARHIATGGPLDARRCAFIATQVLSALGAAHAAGIIHRDIKPDNVFLTSIAGVDDIAKVLDFGVAKLRESNDGMAKTATGTVLGSPAYMSPEQARGREIDARSDIYAVGACMFHALSGRMPFQATSINALLFAIVEDSPPSLRLFRPDLEPEFVAIVERALSKDPSQRFASAEAMREVLAVWARPSTEQHMRVAVSAGLIDPSARTAISALQANVPASFAAQATRASGASGASSADANQAAQITDGVGALSAATSNRARRGGRGRAWVASVVGLAVMGALGYFVFLSHESQPGFARGPRWEPEKSPRHESRESQLTEAPGAPEAPGATESAEDDEDAGQVRAPTTGSASEPTSPTSPLGFVTGDPSARATNPAMHQQGAQAEKPVARRATAARTARCTGTITNNVVTPATLRAFIDARATAINACYAASEFDAVDHQYTIYEFKITAEAKVTSVGPIGSAPLSATLTGCIARALQNQTLAPFGPLTKPEGGAVRFWLNAELPK